MSDRAVVAWFIAAIIGLVVLITTPIWAGSYYTQRSNCHAFGQKTGRDVQFVVYTKVVGLPFSWDCLTPTSDGKWIPTKNLREFGEQP